MDPFDKREKIEDKKHFKYGIFYDKENQIQIVEMQLRSRRGSFLFILSGTASNENDLNEYMDYEEQKIYLDKDIHEFFFDEGIKNPFGRVLKNLCY